MQGIIQASWNWPIARKDIELYGVRGQIFCDNSIDVRYQTSEKTSEQHMELVKLERPFDDPFSFLQP